MSLSSAKYRFSRAGRAFALSSFFSNRRTLRASATAPGAPLRSRYRRYR